jgi:hypothetical protein
MLVEARRPLTERRWTIWEVTHLTDKIVRLARVMPDPTLARWSFFGRRSEDGKLYDDRMAEVELRPIVKGAGGR